MVKFTDKLEEKRSKESKDIKPAMLLVVVGNPKGGKTSFACTAQEDGLTVLLNFENRVAHIPETDNLKIWPNKYSICTEERIEALLGFMRKNKDHGIKYVIIDTIDTLFYNHQKVITDKEGKLDMGYAKRNIINDKILTLINTLKDELFVHQIITAHSKMDKNTGKQAMNLAQDLKNMVNTRVDFLFYLDVNEQKKRVLHTNNNYLYECGQSTEIGKEIPDTVEDPTIMKILNYMKGAKDGSVEQGIQAEDKKVN